MLFLENMAQMKNLGVLYMQYAPTHINSVLFCNGKIPSGQVRSQYVRRVMI
jgi:hypothetical protein